MPSTIRLRAWLVSSRYSMFWSISWALPKAHTGSRTERRQAVALPLDNLRALEEHAPDGEADVVGGGTSAKRRPQPLASFPTAGATPREPSCGQEERGWPGSLDPNTKPPWLIFGQEIKTLSTHFMFGGK